MICFSVPGEPVAKARPKFRSIHTGVFQQNQRTGSNEERVFAHSYTPKKSANFENLIKLACMEVMGAGNPMLGPLRVKITALFAIPKSMPKRDQRVAETETMPKLTKPDVDNVLKAVLDGLNTVAFADDKQVCSVTCEKFYSVKPRTVVEIHAIETTPIAVQEGIL